METHNLGDRIAAAKRSIRHKATDGIERRTVPTTIEVRATSAGAEFKGHAAVFHDLSEDLGFFDSWYERVDPKAFDTVLRKNPDVRALVNHNPDLSLARSTVKGDVGWLSLEADDVGLAYSFVPTPTTYAADLRANVDAGVVSQSSFAFRVARHGDTWEEDEEGRLIRTITQFSELYDVSPVTYPAYPTTDVGMASADPATDDEDEPNEESSTDDPNPAPDPERAANEGDSPSVADDGGTEDEQVGTSARDERAERLRVRIGEPPL